jgi:hypothetical protein
MKSIDPRQIAPSQNFLKEDTVRFILECLRNGDEASLPPEPILRQDTEGRPVAIDGHNLLAVRAFMNQRQDVHIAISPEDGLSDDEGGAARNEDLRNKFESSLVDRDKVVAEGIVSFDDLIQKYPNLFKDAS